MTPEERAEPIAKRWGGDFGPQAMVATFREQIAQAIREAEATMRERCAKIADEAYEMNKPDELAADIARRIRALE